MRDLRNTFFEKIFVWKETNILIPHFIWKIEFINLESKEKWNIKKVNNLGKETINYLTIKR